MLRFLAGLRKSESMTKKLIKQKLILIIFGLFLCVILLEIVLRIGGFMFLSLQEYRNRMSLKKKGSYRILCLGESTTALLGKNSYPSLLEEILNQQNIGIKFSVINKGICGANTGSIALHLEDNLNKYTPDMVITMIGINDGGLIVNYKKISDKKITFYFEKFRIYKLIKLFKAHAASKNNAREIYESKKNVLSRENNWEKLAKNIEKNPENYQECIELGEYFFYQGKYTTAEEIFKMAIEINSENEWAYLRLAMCLVGDREDYARAEELLKKAMEINPENEFTHLLLGSCWADQGEYDRAEKVVKKAIKICPDNELLYFDLGKLFLKKKEYLRAEKMFNKVIRLTGRRDEACIELGAIYKKQGKHGLAKEYFQKANNLRLENVNINTFYNYRRLKEIIFKRGIKLVCVQYPMRSIKSLKKIFDDKKGMIFVDNEEIFKKVVMQGSYEKYFSDSFASDFGHCTSRGNKLLAQNIANVIMKDIFNE